MVTTTSSAIKTLQSPNRPELSKHRKRQATNMSGTVIQYLSSHLFDCLQAGYWNRSNWIQIKGDVEQFAQSLAHYSEYLEKSLKKIRLNHSLPSPVRELSDNLHFQFLPVCDSMQYILTCNPNSAGKDSQLSPCSCCPNSCRAKYNFIQTLKRVGFPFPTAILSYTGNNVGSLHFIWKVECSSDISFSLNGKEGHSSVPH